MVYSVKINTEEVQQWIDSHVLKQMRYAGHIALRRTAFLARSGVIDQMRARFDRPTPYTLKNSVYVDKATKGYEDPRARVYITDFGGKGTAAEKFLLPEFQGGGRQRKPLEKQLIGMRLMGSGQYAIPAQGAKRDAYGNPQRGQIQQIRSALRIASSSGVSANRTGSKRSQRKASGSDYFVGEINGEQGIWQRMKGGSAFGALIRPVFIFTDRAPRYRIRVPFDRIIQNVAKARLKEQYERAFSEAIATAKR